jgi:hypothetical protein
MQWKITAVPVGLDNHRKILSKYNGLKALVAQFDSKTFPFCGASNQALKGWTQVRR